MFSANMTVLHEQHTTKLQNKYGISPDSPVIQDLIRRGLLASVSPDEVRRLLGRDDVDSGGMLLRYPNAPNTFTIRLNTPLTNGEGKTVKYLRSAGQGSRLYLPLGVDMGSSEIWITEGELKALAGSLRGLPVVALPGIWNWRSTPENADLYGEERIPDDEAMILDLQRDWSGKNVVLIYDSDINKQHPGHAAFERLAEQLYRQGAEEVRIVTLPSLTQDGKTGLDDFLLLREQAGKDPVSELKLLVARTAVYLPTGDGAEAFADRLIAKKPDDPDAQVTAAAAILASRGEVYCRGWLKQHVKTKEMQQAVLKEATTKIPQRLAPRPVQTTKNILSNPSYAEILPKLANTRYRVDRNGRLCFAKFVQTTAGVMEEEIPLANFVPFPLREIVKDDGQETETVFELAGVLAGGKQLPAVKVPAERFATMNWIPTAWGLNANLEPGLSSKDRVRHCVQSMAVDIPKDTVYGHLGWRKIENRWCYLHAGGAVGGEGIQTETDSQLSRYRLPAEDGDVITALKASLSLLGIAPGKITYPLLSLSYLAPLCEPLRRAGVEPAFTVDLYGQSGTLKSSTIAVFLSHFGDFTEYTLPASFSSTANAVEKLLFQAKDCLLVVDDLHPVSDGNEMRKMQAVAEKVFRGQGNRSSRARMKSDTSLRRSYSPRGLAVVTGEETPGGQSTLARGLTIEMKAGDVNIPKLSEAQKNRGLLPYAMKSYLSWLAPQLDELPGQFKAAYENLRDRAVSGEQHLRLAGDVADLFIGLATFLDFAKTQGVITQAEQEAHLTTAWQVFLDLAAEQDQRVRAERPAQRFLDIIRELFTQKLIYVKSPDGGAPTDAELLGWESYTSDGEEPAYSPGKAGTFLGWSDEDFLYLLPEATYREVFRFASSQGNTFPVKSQTLWKHLEAEGVLVVEQDSGRVYRTVQAPKKLIGAPKRVLKLDTRKIF